MEGARQNVCGNRKCCRSSIQQYQPQIVNSIRMRSAVCLLLLFIIFMTAYLLTSEGRIPTQTLPLDLNLKRRHPFQDKPVKLKNEDDLFIAGGGKGCKIPLKRRLDDIFLVINFNHAFYQNIPTLLKYYSPVFPHYAICGPKRNRKYKVIRMKYPQGEIGFYSYQCLALVMRQHQGYRGYLYLNDDMIVNWWSLLNLDKNRLWVGCFPNFDNANPIDKPAPNRWWKRANTAGRCSSAFHAVEKRPWTAQMKRTYLFNTNNKKLCLSCWSDIYYVPRKYQAQFLSLVDIFYSHSVFLEAAMPMIMSLLERRQHQNLLPGIYLPEIFGEEKDYLEGGVAWQVYTRQLTFIHPYKLSGYNRTININSFKEIVMDVSEEVLNTQCLDIVHVKTNVDENNFHWQLGRL